MKHFLMVFNRKTGALRMKEYADVRDAILQRLEEEQANDNPDVEIVVIGAPSLEDLKVTHSRYFALGARREGFLKGRGRPSLS